MNKKVDVAIIGSGPGGSVAGAYLAKGGLKTVVFERTQQIAGLKYGAGEVAPGFNSDDFAHFHAWCRSLNNGMGCWGKALREVGASYRWVVTHNLGTWVKATGTVIPAPYCSNGKAFMDFMGSLSPVPLPEEMKQAAAEILDELILMPPEYIWSAEAEQISFEEWLDQRTQDPAIKYLFAVMAAPIVVLPTDVLLKETSLGTLVQVLIQGAMNGGIAFAATHGGPQRNLVTAFTDVIVEHGGEVLTNHTVERVLIDGDVAKGIVVRTPEGREETYEAKYVVMATHYPAVPKLLGEHLPDSVRKSIDGFDKHHNTAMEAHFALDKVLWTYGVAGGSVLDENGQAAGTITFPSQFEPYYAPAGKQQCWYEIFLPTEEYKTRTQDEWVEWMIDMLESFCPGFRDAIIATDIHVIAPATSQLFSPTPKIPLDCPGISRLYFASDYTQCEGFVVERAAAAGMTVAKKILRREGRVRRHDAVLAGV